MNPPRHLWIIGLLAVLWNAGGVSDYVMMQTQNEDYLSKINPEQIRFFEIIPTWVHASWAIADWGSLLGSLLLMLRSKWAGSAFAVSLIALIATSIHNMFILEPSALELMSQGALYMTAATFVIAIFLFFYARAMGRKGVLL